MPSRSLLSRLTDHYMQIIANRAPVGFEAEFVNQRGETICYRGILMPFSSDGDTIDFIYGVINWKRVDEQPPAASAAMPPISRLEPSAEDRAELPESIEPPSVEPAELVAERAGRARDRGRAPARISLGGRPARTSVEDDAVAGASRSTTNAGLADRLWAARETAEVGQGRRRPHPRRALPGAVAGL